MWPRQFHFVSLSLPLQLSAFRQPSNSRAACRCVGLRGSAALANSLIHLQNPLQSILIAAAQLKCRTCSSDHVMPQEQELHCLRFLEGTMCELVIPAFHCLWPHPSVFSMWSAFGGLTMTLIGGDCTCYSICYVENHWWPGVSHCNTEVWNSLLCVIPSACKILTFRHLLKSELLILCYHNANI